MKELQDKLSAHRSSTPSRWREKAMERQANKEWLRYSQKIAMMMLDKMEELGITPVSYTHLRAHETSV